MQSWLCTCSIMRAPNFTPVPAGIFLEKRQADVSTCGIVNEILKLPARGLFAKGCASTVSRASEHQVCCPGEMSDVHGNAVYMGDMIVIRKMHEKRFREQGN